MLGGVFVDTTGIAPGYKGSLSWRKLELYSEGEYVFDTGSSSDSFFYNWSEVTLAPVEWFRFGLVTQRTRGYQTDRDIQRGGLAGVALKNITPTPAAFLPADIPTSRRSPSRRDGIAMERGRPASRIVAWPRFRRSAFAADPPCAVAVVLQRKVLSPDRRIDRLVSQLHNAE